MSGRRIGRPSKGDRRVRYFRLPVEIDELVVAEAERTGLPVSDVLAFAVATHFGRSMPPGSGEFEQLKVTA